MPCRSLPPSLSGHRDVDALEVAYLVPGWCHGPSSVVLVRLFIAFNSNQSSVPGAFFGLPAWNCSHAVVIVGNGPSSAVDSGQFISVRFLPALTLNRTHDRAWL